MILLLLCNLKSQIGSWDRVVERDQASLRWRFIIKRYNKWGPKTTRLDYLPDERHMEGVGK